MINIFQNKKIASPPWPSLAPIHTKRHAVLTVVCFRCVLVDPRFASVFETMWNSSILWFKNSKQFCISSCQKIAFVVYLHRLHRCHILSQTVRKCDIYLVLSDNSLIASDHSNMKSSNDFIFEWCHGASIMSGTFNLWSAYISSWMFDHYRRKDSWCPER